MKRYLLAVILSVLISISGAVSESPGQQVGYNLGSLQFNQIVDPSISAIKVIIKDNSFQPPVSNVPVGATVEWHNQDSVQHTVKSDIQGLFESGALMPGEKYTFTFNAPGNYGYRCSFHPGMQGVITVTGTAAIAANSARSQNASIERSRPAAWSETPLSSGELLMSADSQPERQSATAGSGLQLQLNPAMEQSAGQASGQDLGLVSSQAALQKFSQYYRSTSEAPEDQITSPTRIDLAEVQPTMLYFGSTQKAVPYTQYQSYALSTGMNSLWISGASSWTQYAVVPLGSMLNMITLSPGGGYGYLYEIYPDGRLDKNSYYFYPYNQIGFYADEIGQHQLFFNIAGQPSNVIVIDVVSYQPPVQPVYNLAAITISSAWLRGYNVYVDGSYQATEAMTGDPAGTVSINVPGNQYHNIAIDGSGLTFSDYKYFKSGYAYQLNV